MKKTFWISSMLMAIALLTNTSCSTSCSTQTKGSAKKEPSSSSDQDMKDMDNMKTPPSSDQMGSDEDMQTSSQYEEQSSDQQNTKAEEPKNEELNASASAESKKTEKPVLSEVPQKEVLPIAKEKDSASDSSTTSQSEIEENNLSYDSALTK